MPELFDKLHLRIALGQAGDRLDEHPARGAFPILGPTTSAVLQRAHCPVAVVGHG